jgi:RNA polymerase sigma factor (sigma-70 family)
MAGMPLGTVSREMDRLYSEGTIAGLDDAELLRRFVSRGDERAFAALVARHGAMVLATCRGILRDPHDAEDAFQATFLVLARKAGTIRAREALGGWLHRVAHRAAIRARVEFENRRRSEGRAQYYSARQVSPEPFDEARHVLHEEIARLPERLRLAVVVCELEGLTHARAAERLQWGEATVRRRLARARDLLRGRLTRRGLAPAIGLLGAATAPQPVSAALSAAAVANASRFAAGAAEAAAVPASIAHLAHGVLRTLAFARWKPIVAVLAIGLGATGALATAPRAPEPAPAAPEEERPKPPPAETPLRRALNEALPAADALDPYDAAWALHSIGQLQTKRGDLADARETLSIADRTALKVTIGHNRDLVLLRIASARAKAGDREAARETFERLLKTLPERIADETGGHAAYERPIRVSLLTDLAGMQASSGDRPAAMKTLELAAAAARDCDEENAPEAFGRLISAQMKAGDYEGAFRSFSEYADKAREKISPSMLDVIIQGTPKADGEAARKILARARGLADTVTPQKAWTFKELAETQARTGDIPGALQTVQDLENEGQESDARRVVPMALAAIAREQASTDAEGARATLDEAFAKATGLEPSFGYTRSECLGKVAEAQAALGEIEKAVAIYEAMDENASKAPALAAIALARSKAGDKEAARITLREAVAVVEEIRARPQLVDDDPDRTRTWALGTIALAQAEVGDFAGAIGTARSHGDDAQRSGLLAEIAPIQARAGEWEEARRLAEGIKDAKARLLGLAGVAKAQAEAGDIDGALTWAGKLPDPKGRARALLGVAEGAASRRPSEGRP